jgi:hypothetical protein
VWGDDDDIGSSSLERGGLSVHWMLLLLLSIRNDSSV